MMTAAVTACVTLVGQDAEAQFGGAICADRKDVVSHLDKSFGEHRNSLMLDGRGNLVEMFVNGDTGSWTLVVTSPSGPTCVLRAGEDFVQDLQAAKTPEVES